MDGGKFVIQLIKIVLGYICALLVAAGFLAWGFFRAGQPGDDPIMFATMVGSGLVGASAIGAASAVPAGVLILISELFKMRGPIFHLAAGGGIAFLVWTLGADPGGTGIRSGNSVALTAGFFAGAAYWLVAGRTAGSWNSSAPESSAADDARG